MINREEEDLRAWLLANEFEEEVALPGFSKQLSARLYERTARYVKQKHKRAITLWHFITRKVHVYFQLARKKTSQSPKP